jgi:hypothetical protein
MSLENIGNLPQLILAAVVCIITAMGLWYLGLSRGSLKIKQFAVMIGVFPVLIGFVLFFSDKLSDNTEFRGAAVFGSPSHIKPRSWSFQRLQVGNNLPSLGLGKMREGWHAALQ